MALQQALLCQTLIANADLSASQFCFVAINSSSRIVLPAAGGDCVGVLQDKPEAAGREAEVAMLNGSGRVKVIAGATVAAGAKVQADAAGHAITAASGDHVLGTALTGGADGDIIEILPGSRMLLP